MLASRLCRILGEGTGLSRLYFVPTGARERTGRCALFGGGGGAARPPPPGVAPEASEELF
jgi:hypothetical protein